MRPSLRLARNRLDHESHRPRSIRHALLLGIAAVPVGVGAELVGGAGGPLAVADLVVGLAFCWLGLLMWWRGGRLPAFLMVATGFAWLAGGYATALLLLHRGPLVHLLVGYPSGRPRTWTARLVTAGAYLEAVVYPLGRDDWVTLLGCGAVLATVTAGYLRSGGAGRRARAVALAGAAAVTLVLGFGAAARIAGVAVQDLVLWAYLAALLGVAVLVFVDHRWGPWRQGTIVGLVLELGELDHGGAQRAKLAHALGDPSVQLAYWVPEAGGYVDIAGRPVEEPAPDAHRVLTVLEHDGTRLGALVHDAAVVGDEALVEDIASLARIALVNARLQAEVRAGVAEVEASRRRLVAAADSERRRLERDLHDGAERRLLAVGELLEDGGADLRELLATTLAELTEFARGVHPRALTESGLRTALAELVAAAPFPVELDVPDLPDLSPPAAAAVYFVCSEALANVAKHAGADSARVRVCLDGGRITAEVADDGAGGADLAHGSGLQGLADRVGALGGTFHVDSPRGRGTRVVCELPQ